MQTHLTILASLLVGAAGCATSGVGHARHDRAATTPGRVQLTLASATLAERVFPMVVDARLPTADRRARQIRYEVGDTATAQVRLCVEPGGRVERVELVRGTGHAAFDEAVTTDARAWKFAPMPGPAGLRTCDRAVIHYQPGS